MGVEKSSNIIRGSVSKVSYNQTQNPGLDFHGILAEVLGLSLLGVFSEISEFRSAIKLLTDDSSQNTYIKKFFERSREYIQSVSNPHDRALLVVLIERLQSIGQEIQQLRTDWIALPARFPYKPDESGFWTPFGFGIPDDAAKGLDYLAIRASTVQADINVDAKGDILVATANNALNNLTVGANDTLLVADSVESMGMRWATTLGGIILTSPVINTSISGSAFLDEDDLVSDAADKVASQQSIKAYIDASGLFNIVEDTTPQLGGQLDVNGQAIGDGTRELLTFIEDGSAVNHLEIENQATGSGPILRATGDNANVDLHLDTKGTGNIKCDDDLDVSGAITVTGTVDGRDLVTDGTKLDGVESGADVTDVTNVDAAGAVMESDYNAQTILQATSDNTPVPLTVGASTVVGRKSTGNIVALTAAETRTILNVADGAVADHGDLSGLTDVNDHPDYALVDGTRSFTGNVTMDGTLVVNTINEKTAAAGVTIETVLIKDGKVDGFDLSAFLSRLRKRSFSWYIQDPVTGNEYLVAHVPNGSPITIIAIGGEVDVATTASFQVEQHAKGQARASGTSINVLNSALAFPTGGVASSSFNDATVPSDTWLIFKCIDISGSPTKAWGYIDYEVND